jgi:hypothetical protein
MLIFMVLWDFLWFILNPSFTLKKFNPDHVWWHKRWTGGMPNDYLWGIGVSFLLLVPAASADPFLLTRWFSVIVTLGFLTAFTHVLVHVLPQ